MQILTSGILNDTVVYEQSGGASISSQHLNFRPALHFLYIFFFALNPRVKHQEHI